MAKRPARRMRILYITSTRIGDAVLSSGILAALAERYPRARFTIACGPAVAPLFEAVPQLERIITLEKDPEAPDAHWWRLWRQVAFGWWSLIVDLRRSIIPFVVPAFRRIRQARDIEGEHKVRQAGHTIGLDPPPDPKIWVTGAHRARAAELIPDGPPVLALGPTANWGGKQWPAERFVELVRQLTGQGGILSGARLAVFAAPHEREAAVPVLEAVPAARRIDLAGRTDLLTAYACIERAAMYIGNDSGLMHIAAATGVPTLGLFGPSKEAHYGPWGPNGAAVRTRESFEEIVGAPGYNHKLQITRMNGLSVEMVRGAAEGLWARAHPAVRRRSA